MSKVIDDDTDSDNEKLPTLDLLCHQVKSVLSNVIDLKFKKLKARRRSYHNHTKSVLGGGSGSGDPYESLFLGTGFGEMNGHPNNYYHLI